MNSNTVCLRIFLVLSSLLVAAFDVFVFGSRVLTPPAVCFLPTETAEATYANPYVAVEFHGSPQKSIFESEISYSGHTATLITTSPPTHLVSTDANTKMTDAELLEAMRPGFHPKKPEPPAPTFNVRYVKSFPLLVTLDLPNGSIWSYFGVMWSAATFMQFITLTGLLVLLLLLLYRNVRRTRQEYRR